MISCRAELIGRIQARVQLFLTLTGWSRRKLSQQAGLDQSTVHRLLTIDRLPSLYNCVRLCEAMGITLCDLVESPDPADLRRAASLRRQMGPGNRVR